MHHRAKKFASHQALRGKMVTHRLLADTVAAHGVITHHNDQRLEIPAIIIAEKKTISQPYVKARRSQALVRETIQTLCTMYQGASKMRQRARLSVYWPHMDVDIANAAATCEDCISLLPFLPAEPLISNEPATRPFDFLHADLGRDDGRYFLVIVDQFSSWSHVVVFPDKNTSARRLIDAFRQFFMD
jgi:hypothetical protein